MQELRRAAAQCAAAALTSISNAATAFSELQANGPPTLNFQQSLSVVL